MRREVGWISSDLFTNSTLRLCVFATFWHQAKVAKTQSLKVELSKLNEESYGIDYLRDCYSTYAFAIS